MLQINNLHATVGGTPILNGLSLAVNAGEIHAIMGPNGAGKSTLAYVLGGRPGYEVTGGSVSFSGKDLLALDPHERAALGLFLGFQYPVEIPGVSNVQFLREALNAQRKARGEEPLSGGDFLKLAKEKAALLFNQVQRQTLLARELAPLAERIGLPALTHQVARRQCYQHAMVLGWKALDGPAREEILQVALEITTF